MKSKGTGIIKQILKEHFSGFWEMNERFFPEKYREDIKETVEKTIRCGTKDIGYARYECLGCEGNLDPKFVCFTCKSRFCHRCEKNIQTNVDRIMKAVNHDGSKPCHNREDYLYL